MFPLIWSTNKSNLFLIELIFKWPRMIRFKFLLRTSLMRLTEMLFTDLEGRKGPELRHISPDSNSTLRYLINGEKGGCLLIVWVFSDSPLLTPLPSPGAC